MPLILGYAAINETLSREGITPNKTVRQKNANIETLKELSRKNLRATKKIIEWNDNNGIMFYRMSSAIFPHISNCALTTCESMTSLVYDPNDLMDTITEIKTEQRLTFHPDPYVVLNSPNNTVYEQCVRELYWHAKTFDIMGRDMNSVIVMHGGGVYGDIESSKQRFIDRFCLLPESIRNRIVIENDEFKYSLDNIVDIHNKLSAKGFNVPIVLDWFHHECYTGKAYKGEHLDTIIRSWQGRKIKMHLSEQAKGNRKGSHSDYVETIPRLLFDIASQHDIWLMIEAKKKEQAVLHLKDKYNLF